MIANRANSISSEEQKSAKHNMRDVIYSCSVKLLFVTDNDDEQNRQLHRVNLSTMVSLYYFQSEHKCDNTNHLIFSNTVDHILPRGRAREHHT